MSYGGTLTNTRHRPERCRHETTGAKTDYFDLNGIVELRFDDQRVADCGAQPPDFYDQPHDL
jgi:hypothetical protein